MLTYATKDGSYIRESSRIGIASNEDGIVRNADGSTILRWSSSPEGKENCMPVIDGEGFFVLFRLYGPEEAFFDRTFVLPDITQVKK
jgi:hypothetical protein